VAASVARSPSDEVNPPVRIVPIRDEHIASFYAVLDEVARERRYLAMTQAPPLEDVRAFSKRMMDAGLPRLVALVGDEAVGWCDLDVKLRETLKHTAILGMGIARAQRGRGIGLRLMEATLDAARNKGLTRIELMVRVDNERAKKLYDKVGFVVEGLCRRYMLVDGQYYDGYLMAALL
jgi:RimJ/RimL family protein N-acetyltransferase